MSSESTETKKVEEIPDTSKLENVRNQLEFYFGDDNMPRDKFLLAEAKKNEEGWIDISVLLKFKKLASMTTDPKVVAESVKDSTLLQLSPDQTQIRRTTPVPDLEEMNLRTVFAKNLNKSLSLADLFTEFKPYGEIGAIRMKKDKNDSFVGQSFIVFKNKSDAENLINKKKIIIKDEEVELLDMKTYNEVEANHPRKSKAEKKKEEEERMKQEIEKRKKEIEEEGKNYPHNTILFFSNLPSNHTLNFQTLKDYFNYFGEVEYLDYNNNNNNNKENDENNNNNNNSNNGYCRFKTSNACERAIKEINKARDELELMKKEEEKKGEEKKEGEGEEEEKKESSSDKTAKKSTFLIGGVIPTVRLVEGEEEEKCWKTVVEKKLTALLRSDSFGRRGRGGRRGGRGRGKWGRGGGRGRGRNDDDAEEEKGMAVTTIVSED